MVTIRDLASLQDYAECVALQDETWGAGFSERVPTAILRVSQMIGGVSAGAFDADGRLAGFVFGMTGVRDGELVHWSDMLAVRSEWRGKGLGRQLKQYQRDAVVARGVKSMLWTFDPLQAGNAHFNINRLAAMPESYQPDMYGSTGSTLHGAMPTDRFIVRWDLQREPLSRARVATPTGRDTEFVLANPLDADGLPFVSFVELTPPPREPGYRVQVPASLNAAQQPDVALRWRMVVRGIMVTLLSHGYAVTGFRRPEDDSLPFYVVQRLGAT